MTEHTDSDTARFVARLIHAWDGDLQELITLVEMVARIRKRALMEQQARLAHAEYALAIYQDAIVRILARAGQSEAVGIHEIALAAHLKVKGER